MSLFSVLPDLGFGVTEMLSVLVNALSIMLLAFKRPISHTLSGLIPSTICHRGARSDISAVGAVFPALLLSEKSEHDFLNVFLSVSCGPLSVRGKHIFLGEFFFQDD